MFNTLSLIPKTVFRVMSLTGLYMPFPKIEVIVGSGSYDSLIESLKNDGVKRPIILTDEGIVKFGLYKNIEKSLKEAGLEVTVFSEIKPDPSFSQVDKGINACLEHDADCVIAIGGGSVMDASKIINYCAKYKKDPRKVWGFCVFFEKVTSCVCTNDSGNR